MKVITLCGSLRFKNKMMEIAEELALEGNCVITPVFPTKENYTRTDKEMESLKMSHFKKIEFSDAILVVDIDNYIGNSTKLEIEFAKKLNKEIIYYTKLKNL